MDQNQFRMRWKLSRVISLYSVQESESDAVEIITRNLFIFRNQNQFRNQMRWKLSRVICLYSVIGFSLGIGGNYHA
jgi:hypothetical protein